MRFVPATYPPSAPIAFDSVPTWMSTRPCMSKWSMVPRPFFPKTPLAWASSTIMMAAGFFGRRAQLGQRAEVAIHAEDAIGDEQLPRPRRQLPEHLARRVDILMREDFDRRPAETTPIDDARVIQFVGNDEVILG